MNAVAHLDLRFAGAGPKRRRFGRIPTLFRMWAFRHAATTAIHAGLEAPLSQGDDQSCPNLRLFIEFFNESEFNGNCDKV
jgi:hypothetical protein